MIGSWDIKVTLGGMPQKIATAFSDFNDKILGAEYTPIAYLGSQQVNGINHAILAEQLLTTGKDVRNVVVIIFNEKEDKVILSNIERVVTSGGEFGGIKIDAKIDIPEDATEALQKVLTGLVGVKIEPFAYLGQQVTKGTDYILAATVAPVTIDPEVKVAVIVANPMENKLYIKDILNSDNCLGYAFTWATLGKPLGEWP